MDICWLDTETRSRCDLIKRGAYNYSADPSTEVLVACWALNHGPVMQWRAWKGEPMPAQLAGLLADPKVQIRAHAPFERHLLKLALARYYDVAAQMRALAIPGGLDAAARFLKLREQKNPRGAVLIRLLSVPQKDGQFINDPHLLEEFTGYCAQDVVVMRQLSLGTRQLDDDTLALYRANEEVNDRGIPIDGELCEWAIRYADEAREEAAKAVVRITGGTVTKARGENVKHWLYERLPEGTHHVMLVPVRESIAANVDRTKSKFNRGVPPPPVGHEWKLSLDRDTREALALAASQNPDDFHPDVMEVVEAAEAASPASVAKYQAMLDLCSEDGRLRGSFILDGAGQTGRFSAWGAQVHNFPRACAKDPEAVRKVMKRHGSLAAFGSTLQVLKSMLRAAIWPGAGRQVVRSDWSAIEARGLPWLAASPGALRYLDAFRDKDRDIYSEQGHAVGVGWNRQAGKVLVLSLGYGGGVGALGNVAKSYGVTFGIPLPTIVARWRGANQWAVAFWAALAAGARRAIIAPGSVQVVGRVSFQFVKDVNWEALTMTLPSGRKLYYPFAKLEPNEEGGTDITYAKSAWRPKAHKPGEMPKAWPRARLWGGHIAENATQGACADLLRLAVLAGGSDVIAHVHDEMVSEATAKTAARIAKEQENRMLALPAWAKGFPLAVETDISERFRK